MNRPIIWLATTNNFKLGEYKKLLPNYDVKSIVDLPSSYYETSEKGLTFSDNALLKAKDLAHFINGIAIGDDSGIEVEVLNQFPGIYSKRWASPETNWKKINLKLLDLVANSKNPANRKATMITSIAFFDARTGQNEIFEARVKGRLVENLGPQNTPIFGYDPVFIPHGYNLPYSQLSKAKKNQISARALAIKKFIAFLERNDQNNDKKN